MRTMPFALTCCVALAALALVATTVRADAIKATPELTVFTEGQTQSGTGPTVLRGEATRRGVVDGRLGDGYEASRFQLGAGAKLWLTDPVSGEVIVCDERRSSQVGGRFVGCLEDRLPYSIYE